MPKKFRLTAPKGKKKGTSNTSGQTARSPQPLSVSAVHDNDLCMSRVSGLVIDSFTQTENVHIDLSESDESTQTDQYNEAYCTDTFTQSDVAKTSYNDESTQTDCSVNTSHADAFTQTDDVKASYNDESTQTDSVKTTCADESNITEEKNCDELNHGDVTSQLYLESSAATKTVPPPSFIQAKELFSIVNETNNIPTK